jgi:hypothetical protein
MVLPLHVGTEHPDLIWLLATGVLAFAAGLGVHLFRSPAHPGASSPAEDEGST